jgi:hypothetical protein
MRMDVRKRVTALATMVAMVVGPALFAADVPAVTPAPCASSAAPVKIVSYVDTEAVWSKVYFKAAGQQAEYYVPMRRAADGSMWAFIPAPEVTTKSFQYRVVSMDSKGVQTSSTVATATTALSCPAQKLTSAEQRAASNMVVGLTSPAQSPVPVGFRCQGVVSYITVAGEMRNNYECRAVVASAAQPGATTGAAGSTTGNATGAAAASGNGLSTRTVIAITAGAAVAGGLLYEKHHKHHKPVSPSRP